MKLNSFAFRLLFYFKPVFPLRADCFSPSEIDRKKWKLLLLKTAIGIRTHSRWYDLNEFEAHTKTKMNGKQSCNKSWKWIQNEQSINANTIPWNANMNRSCLVIQHHQLWVSVHFGSHYCCCCCELEFFDLLDTLNVRIRVIMPRTWLGIVLNQCNLSQIYSFRDLSHASCVLCFHISYVFVYSAVWLNKRSTSAPAADKLMMVAPINHKHSSNRQYINMIMTYILLSLDAIMLMKYHHRFWFKKKTANYRLPGLNRIRGTPLRLHKPFYLFRMWFIATMSSHYAALSHARWQNVKKSFLWERGLLGGYTYHRQACNRELRIVTSMRHVHMCVCVTLVKTEGYN